MSVTIDDEIKANRERFNTQVNEKSSSFGLVLIIAIGVFLGTTTSTLAIRLMDGAIMRYELNELNKKLAIDQATLRERLKEQSKINAARQQQQSKINAARQQQQMIENEKRQAGYRQAMETCNFWRDQYRRAQTNSNKYQRDQACNFVNEFR